jgi:hypothetical protein
MVRRENHRESIGQGVTFKWNFDGGCLRLRQHNQTEAGHQKNRETNRELSHSRHYAVNCVFAQREPGILQSHRQSID